MNKDEATGIQPRGRVSHFNVSARLPSPLGVYPGGQAFHSPATVPEPPSRKRPGRPRGSSRTSKLGRRDAALDGKTLEHVGGLLNVSSGVLRRARLVFALLGDPGRRTIVERLSRRPQRPGAVLPGVTGMDGPDLYHRLRSLRWGGVLIKDRHQIYRVDPASLESARQYIDALIVVSSLATKETFQ